MDTVQNHPATQSMKDTISNGWWSSTLSVRAIADELIIGPVGEKVKESAAKTGSDFKGLSDSKAPPAQGAATGQPLTRELHIVLPWEWI